MPKQNKKNQKPQTEETQTQPQEPEQAEAATPAEPQEVPRGPRGEVGVATAGDTIKQMWHEQHHVLQDVGDKHNPRKQLWVKRTGAPSLKKFAKALAASPPETVGKDVARKWFADKRGAGNAKRSDANIARASTEAAASKAARRKKSQGKSGKAAEATPAATATATVAAKGKK